MGDGANEDSEENRWVSAMPDFIFIRMFYVIFKIVEAFVLAIPVILIQLLNVLAQLLVLMMILLFPIVLLVSFIPRMQDLIFGVLKVMFGGLAFPAITSLLTLLIFYIEKLLENLVTSGFDKVLKTLPSLILFGLVFKLLVSVVSKGTIYILMWKYKAELIQFILGSKARMMANDFGNRMEHGMTRTKEIASQVPTRSLSSAQHLGNFALAGAGIGAGMVMHSKDHFQQVGSFFTQKDTMPEDEFEPDIPTETPLKQESTTAPKIKTENESMPTSKKSNLQERKPEQPSGKVEIPIQAERSSTTEDEFHTLKEEWISPFKQHKINSLERELDKYKDPKAMYKAQGSNAFTRAYRKTMTRDDKLRTNIERRNKLTERLNQLRGEYNEY